MSLYPQLLLLRRRTCSLQDENQVAVHKFFKAFGDEVISISSVVNKKTFGKKQDILNFWEFLQSQDDDQAHFFGKSELGMVEGMSRANNIFRKHIPANEQEYFVLVNRLRPYNLTYEDYLPKRPATWGAGAVDDARY